MNAVVNIKIPVGMSCDSSELLTCIEALAVSPHDQFYLQQGWFDSANHCYRHEPPSYFCSYQSQVDWAYWVYGMTDENIIRSLVSRRYTQWCEDLSVIQKIVMKPWWMR